MFTVVQRGRGDYRKELASTPFSDIARIIALAIAERLFPAQSEARNRAEDGACYIEVLYEGNPYARIVLARSEARAWNWEDDGR